MLPLTTILARLAWAALLGSIVGIERSIRRRPSGMRTGFCVSLGAALFTIASIEIARRTGDASPTRIASNIVQGIGFLGAGVILRERGSVVGLTTAATIFSVAAIGMAAGGGLFAISGLGCLLLLFALVVLYYVENWFNLKARYMLFRIYVDPSAAVAKETFVKLSAFYGPNRSVTGDWDTAYFDAKHIIHVQKGKERYALVLSPIGADAAQAEKQLKDLATWVAGQL